LKTEKVAYDMKFASDNFSMHKTIQIVQEAIIVLIPSGRILHSYCDRSNLVKLDVIHYVCGRSTWCSQLKPIQGK
jgi:hypothetical protein